MNSMKNGAKMLLYAAACLALAMAARAAKSPGAGDAVSSDNPYGAIVERNIFDLRDPPAPQVEKAKPPPSNIKLTGITTIFGMKQALFIMNEPGAAGKPPTTRSLMLSEGQRSGALEVLEISPKARTARIKNDDLESLLNIETNKAAIGGGGPGNPGAMPGARMPGYAPPGGPGPGIPQNPYPGSIPMRPVRDNQPNANPQPNYGGGAGAGVQTPAGSINLSGGMATGLNQVPQQPTMTPQEQWTLMEAARVSHPDPGVPIIMPSTPLSSPGGGDSEGPLPGGGGGAPNPGGTGATGSQLPGALAPRTTGKYIVPGN